jgi:hypothetical protein
MSLARRSGITLVYRLLAELSINIGFLNSNPCMKFPVFSNTSYEEPNARAEITDKR